MDTSFSYRKIFPGNNVLVFIPHEDDEINIAGSTIYELKKENFHVTCVYATNGDHHYLAETRIAEAMNALRVLGVPSEDIVILGYPDGGPGAASSPYARGINSPINVDGHEETYGIKGKSDFSMYLNGVHSPYTRKGFISDVEAVIEFFRPDVIIGIDFDSHPDHRACSIALETAIGNLLNRKGNKYFPIVLKSYAYNTGFESIPDFYEAHLYSTRFNRSRLSNTNYDTDNPTLEWKKRLRFPLARECRNHFLQKNILYKAMKWHVSQRAFMKAAQIINSDQVYWARRTDNLAFIGETKVSSGDGAALHDFKMIDTNDISRNKAVFDSTIWEPDKNDPEKTCTIFFDTKQDVSSIILYGNVEKESRILKSRITLSNGYTIDCGPLNINGTGTVIEFPEQREIKWVQYRILKTEGNHPGLTEWEIFPPRATGSKFIKIMVDDNFAYDWTIYPNENPSIGLYTYGYDTDRPSIKWKLNESFSTLTAINEAIKSCDSIIQIQAFDENDESVKDEITLRPGSRIEALCLKYRQFWDKVEVQLDNLRIKRKHHKLKQLKKQQKGKLDK